ncbi:MAG: hypothetical protein COA49_03200 [Bacteroidetes bacterium]|nr:MAG: hypothetical protein COA49_03200 [Bacteroidota bacterium]
MQKRITSHMLRYVLICVGLTASSLVISAQTISGFVSDTQGNPVVGAYVSNGDNNNIVATDINGKYSLELNPGLQMVSCSFIGKKTEAKEFTFVGGQKVIWDITLESEARALDIAVVSAGRFEQSVAEVTVSMEILQPALVESKATTSLESALEQTPGVSMVDGEPQIRSGSGFSYGAGSRVMIMVDDLPVLSGDAGRPMWGFLPLENLDQIEVIKGASSVLYGSAALSGVINIRTRYPDARPLTRVTVQHGAYSNPRSDSSMYWNTTLQQTNIRFLHSRQIGNWDVVIGGNLLGDDGYKGPTITFDSLDVPIDTNVAGYNPFSVDRYGANAQARFNINLRKRESSIPGLTYGLSTNWQKGESLNTLIWGHSSTGLYSSYAGAATRTKQLVGTVDPFIEYLSPSGVRTSFRNRWQHLRNDNDNNQGNNSDVLYSELQSQKIGVWGMEEMAITGGLVHQYTKGEAQLYTGGNEDGVNIARNIAGYLQIDKPIGQYLNVSSGVRYEHFSINGVSEGKPVFRAGANYQVAEETYLRSSLGQGFRFPTIAEKFIRTGLGDLQVYPNEKLRPESSTSIEIGVKQGLKIGGFVGYLDFAVFQQKYTDFIEFSFGTWAPSEGFDNLFGLGFRSLNTGESQVRGAEISLMGQAKWGAQGQHTLDILGGYTYTNPISLTPHLNYNPDSSNVSTTYIGTSHDTTGYILKYRSPHLVRFDAQWTHPHGFVGVSARYQSVIKNFDQAFVAFENFQFVDWGLNNWLDTHPTLPWLIDVRVGVNLNEYSKLSLVISNLFNEEYSVRPLAIEAPRLVNVVYTYEIE